MKRWFPHIFYCCLLILVGLFYWRAIYLADQCIAFLNQPADDIYAMLFRRNQTLKKEIYASYKSYPSPLSHYLWQHTQHADSLTALALAHQLSQDTLCARLCQLTDREPQTCDALNALLLPKAEQRLLSVYRNVWQQQDSLRKQKALGFTLAYLNAKAGGSDTGCGTSPTPGASFTTLLPVVNQHFQADFVLQSYAMINPISISINGQSLPIKEGIGAFKHTFAMPGIYPIVTEVRYTNAEQDSILTAKKTFYLPVKR